MYANKFYVKRVTNVPFDYFKIQISFHSFFFGCCGEDPLRVLRSRNKNKENIC